ncbi:hypothetical protein NBRC111894_2009 [Sporolactobacillus inulinus]|uniref:Uncharacterized protein n=1 Tax=Sporolactobacillus inulinus TaxID=2078 RepID=A0A4Y1ZBL8_9BACL|nr:hypothetical protein NBRC111894_2009 [Sporolactobacillus inulinus]
MSIRRASLVKIIIISGSRAISLSFDDYDKIGPFMILISKRMNA